MEVSMKTTNPNEVRRCCPECGDDKFHLYFNLKKRVFHCFKCGARGRAEPERVYSEEALTEIIEIMEGKRRVDETEQTLVLPECYLPEDEDEDVYSRLAATYLRRRGFYKEIKRNGYLIPKRGEKTYADRFIVPIYDYRGNHITYFQARGYFKFTKPKYLNPIYPKRSSLFCNMGRRLNNTNHLFITEGIFKALNLAKVGEVAVAIFGKEITREQCRIIWRITRKATIMLDPDAYAFAIPMLSHLELLAPPGAEINIIDPPLPPDDMKPAHLKAFISQWRRAHEIL